MPAQVDTSIFDLHHAPEPELIDRCVHCGLCLPTCPTYVLWGREMASPRGRIRLMQLGTQGQVAMNGNFVQHFDTCLGCMACMTACPSGVQYDKLIEATRFQIESRYHRTFSQRWVRKLIFSLFPYPERLKQLLKPLLWYQRTGLQKLLRGSGLLRLLPASLRSMESVLPDLKASFNQDNSRLPAITPPAGLRRRRVGVLLGCVQQVFFSEVNAATIRVLAAEGCEIVAPADQSCCGALMVHAGEEERALAFARRNIDAFEKAEVDTIVINAAGCGSSMKDYGHLLRDDPAYAERAKAFAGKCRDISEVLAELPPRAARKPLPLRVAYHDACHLQHAQRIRQQPRDLLRSIPGVEILEIPESAICCGSAGIYNLVEPHAAAELGERKVQHILSLKPDVVVSSNPGCLLQLGSMLQSKGSNIPVMHIVELLDASERGEAAFARK